MLDKITTALPYLASKAADTSTMSGVVSPIVTLIDSLWLPAMSIVGVVGALYCILLGVKYAKAEEQQEHEKAKKHLKNAIIGFVLIFVLLYLLKTGTTYMTQWYQTNAGVVLTSGQ